MIDTVSIGKIIKKLRCDKNFTQEQLAEKIDISKNYLSKVERGKSKLNAEAFIKMAKVLSFSLEDFGIKIQIQSNNEQQILLNKVLSASPQKTKVYLKTLEFVDDIVVSK